MALFQPGQSGNPNGRPRKIDPRSAEMEKICKKHQEDISEVVDILFEEAKVKKAPWAIKMVVDTFCPKAGTYQPVEMPIKQTNVQINTLLKEMPADEQHELWQLLVKAEKRRPNVIDVTPSP